jgi:hypothetical protein
MDRLEPLRALRAQKIVSIRAYPQARIGLACIELSTESNQTVSVRAEELLDVPFDAYSICATWGGCSEASETEYATAEDEAAFAPLVVKDEFTVSDIEIFRRDEWLEPFTLSYPTVGENPTLQNTGPLGGAPAGAEAVTVISGIAVHAMESSFPPLLIYRNDYPNLLWAVRDKIEIAKYRLITTSNMLGA